MANKRRTAREYAIDEATRYLRNHAHLSVKPDGYDIFLSVGETKASVYKRVREEYFQGWKEFADAQEWIRSSHTQQEEASKQEEPQYEYKASPKTKYSTEEAKRKIEALRATAKSFHKLGNEAAAKNYSDKADQLAAKYNVKA